MWIADDLANDLINRTLIDIKISSKYNFNVMDIDGYIKYKQELAKALNKYERNKKRYKEWIEK